MSHHQRAIATVRKSMADILERKTMNSLDNLQPGCSDKDVSDAGEATPATDAEVVAYIKSLVPKALDIVILEHGKDVVCIGVDIDPGDVER